MTEKDIQAKFQVFSRSGIAWILRYNFDIVTQLTSRRDLEWRHNFLNSQKSEME